QLPSLVVCALRGAAGENQQGDRQRDESGHGFPSLLGFADRKRLLAPEGQIDEIDRRVGDSLDSIRALHRIAGSDAVTLAVVPEKYDGPVPVDPLAEVAEWQGRRRRCRWRRRR